MRDEKIINSEKYFCINCFENENIKEFVKKEGKYIKTEVFKCNLCKFETCNEYEIEDCIQEHIDSCIEKIQEDVSDEEYENNEALYEEKCKKECQKKYRQSCVEKIASETYIIKQDILIDKIKKTIENLYEHDNEHGFYGSASSQYWTEGVASPCMIAGLKPTNEICGDIFGEDGEKIEKIMNGIYGFHECPWLCRCFDKDEGGSFGKWSDFCENVKHKARYFDHNDFKVKDYLNNFIDFFKKIEIIDYKVEIYRARIIDSVEIKQDVMKIPEKELGKVPLDKLKYAKNNRFSPTGISYGYYSFDKITILFETRADIENEVVIGKFELDSSLKIIDFRNNSLAKYKNPYNDEFNVDVYCGEEFIFDFLFDISKPIHENDTLLEYVPTQILSEYIWSLGYDGFIFDSSQNKGGENLVLFGENPKFKDYEFVKIKEKNIEYEYEIL